jgi:hypothetical protein
MEQRSRQVLTAFGTALKPPPFPPLTENTTQSKTGVAPTSQNRAILGADMAVETAKRPEEPPNPNAKVRRKPHRCRPTVDAAIEALRACHGLVGPSAARLGMSRSHLNRMIGNSPRLAAAYHDINENAVDRVEAGLYVRASEAREPAWTQMFLRAKGASRGNGGANGQAGADGALPGSASARSQSCPRRRVFSS